MVMNKACSQIYHFSLQLSIPLPYTYPSILPSDLVDTMEQLRTRQGEPGPSRPEAATEDAPLAAPPTPFPTELIPVLHEPPPVSVYSSYASHTNPH
jgi:hypothetical protein